MDSEKIRNRKLIFYTIMTFMAITLFLAFINAGLFMIFVLGDSVKTFEYASNIEQSLIQNEVPRPFPDSLMESNLHVKNFTNVYDVRDYYFKKDFDEFQEIVKDKFEYSEQYDCKYWTYMWTTYYKYNHERYNWKIKYIDTDNHLFAMVYNESEYCTLEQDFVNCHTLN